MQWRKILLGGGAAVGAAAAFNHLAQRDIGPLEHTLEGTEKFLDWRGHRVAYTVRGSGPPLLLVHSIHAAASSYEWRHNADALAAAHTVYAVDLLGFGRSDRPATRYTARLYLSLISDFAEEVIAAPCVLVASSLSAAYAIVLGARDPGRFPLVVLIGPTGLTRLNKEMGAAGDAGRLAIDTPIVGTAMFNALVSRKSIEAFLKASYADNDLVTPELVEQHFVTAHQPGAKHAPAAFVGGLLNIDVRQAVRRLTQPALLVWGEQAVQAPAEELRAFVIAKDDFETLVVEHAADLPHDERPDEFNAAVAEFVARSWETSAV